MQRELKTLLKERISYVLDEIMTYDEMHINTFYGYYVRTFNKVCDPNVSVIARQIAEEVTFFEILREVSERDYIDMGIRVCGNCGRLIIEGYANDNDEYACCVECRDKLFDNKLDCEWRDEF